MGSSQSLLTTEVEIGVAALVVASSIAVAKYGYSSSSPSTSAPAGAVPSKKGKKKKGMSTKVESEPQAPVVPFPAVIPGEFDAEDARLVGATSDAPSSKPKSKKKKGKAATAVTQPAAREPTYVSPEPEVASTSPAPTKAKKSRKARQKAKAVAESDVGGSQLLAHDTDSSWTRVERAKRAEASGSAQDDTTTTDHAEDGEGEHEHEQDDVRVKDNVRTLAEKLVPKPRKTKVDDMLPAAPPHVARVMRVAPRPGERPVPGFSWADYEDVETSGDPDHAAAGTSTGGSARDDEASSSSSDDPGHKDDADEGWSSVPSRSRKPAFPAVPHATASAKSGTGGAEPQTKKQRQNAAKRAAAKAAKAEQDAAQAAALASHKRSLEKERIAELYKQGGAGGKGKTSGGMSASVQEGGKLVWE